MALLRQLLIMLFMIKLKIIVTLYTYLTLPIYYLIQKPRQKVVKSPPRNILAKKSSSGQTWSRVGDAPTYILLENDTVDEAIRCTATIHDLNIPSLGYRPILDEEVQYDEMKNIKKLDGKILKRYKLGDYQWLTLGQTLDRIEHVARGLNKIGVKGRDRVCLFCETRLEWFLSAQGVLRNASSLVTVFATLGLDGVIHAINETEVTTIVTSYDLLDRLDEVVAKTPKVTTIVYIVGPKPTENRINAVRPDIKVITFDEVEELGEKSEVIQFDKATAKDIAVS